MFCSSLPSIVCRRAYVFFTLCSVRLYLQLFVGGFVMFCSSLPTVVCRRVHVLFTLYSVRLYLQLFVGGFISYLRYVLFDFTSSCLEEGSCLIYVMFCSSLPPVVCRRAHVLFHYVLFVFTSSCLKEGSCLIYVIFCSSLPPVVCRRVHVLFTLCSVRLYFQLFVGGLMSYLRYVLFVFISSCL